MPREGILFRMNYGEDGEGAGRKERKNLKEKRGRKSSNFNC